MRILTLSEPDCTALLAENRLGRLACSKDGQPYVVPVYFACASSCLYAFSMPGRKIDWMRANPLVSVLVEAHGPGGQWRSVIVEGRYEELPDRIGHKKERERAWSLLSRHAGWWEPGGLKPAAPAISDRSDHIFFRIRIDRVSGREARE